MNKDDRLSLSHLFIRSWHTIDHDCMSGNSYHSSCSLFRHEKCSLREKSLLLYHTKENLPLLFCAILKLRQRQARNNVSSVNFNFDVNGNLVIYFTMKGPTKILCEPNF